MFKWIAPTVMALSVLGGIAAPVHADRFDRNIPVHRADDMDNRRGEQARRLEDLTARINNLYSEGRLSREHRDRALDKLQRVRDDVKHRDRFDSDRYRANQDFMDNVSRDVDNWSRSDRGRGDRHLRRDNRWR